MFFICLWSKTSSLEWFYYKQKPFVTHKKFWWTCQRAGHLGCSGNTDWLLHRKIEDLKNAIKDPESTFLSDIATYWSDILAETEFFFGSHPTLSTTQCWERCLLPCSQILWDPLNYPPLYLVEPWIRALCQILYRLGITFGSLFPSKTRKHTGTLLRHLKNIFFLVESVEGIARRTLN